MLPVLIIGADVDLLDLLSTHLRQLGHAVHTAASGTEGIATFERVSPHVTVVDLKMPGMSGMEVLKQLCEKRAVVVVLTGHADIEDAVRAMRLGAESFLTKPVAMDHLAIAIERAADGSSRCCNGAPHRLTGVGFGDRRQVEQRASTGTAPSAVRTG